MFNPDDGPQTLIRKALALAESLQPADTFTLPPMTTKKETKKETN